MFDYVHCFLSFSHEYAIMADAQVWDLVQRRVRCSLIIELVLYMRGRSLDEN